jgi:hypothetical protein
MHRKIKLDNTTYTANIGTLENYRIVIQEGNVTVSADLNSRTPGAEFEAIFHGRERVEILVAPASEEQEITVTNPAYIDPDTTPDVSETIQEVQLVPGPVRYDIGPVELDPDETPLVLAKRAKLAEIAAARWKAEVGGVEVSGMKIDTSRESQSLITGAALAATLDDTYVCQWKTEQGFVTLNAATILAAATAVRQHVQACFDHEAELTAVVAAAEMVEAVESVSWE